MAEDSLLLFLFARCKGPTSALPQPSLVFPTEVEYPCPLGDSDCRSYTSGCLPQNLKRANLKIRSRPAWKRALRLPQSALKCWGSITPAHIHCGCSMEISQPAFAQPLERRLYDKLGVRAATYGPNNLDSPHLGLFGGHHHQL